MLRFLWAETGLLEVAARCMNFLEMQKNRFCFRSGSQKIRTTSIVTNSPGKEDAGSNVTRMDLQNFPSRSSACPVGKALFISRVKKRGCQSAQCSSHL